MSEEKIKFLKLLLKKERLARRKIENDLKAKALLLNESNKKLQNLNTHLESLINRSDSQLQGVFEGIIDAYVIMDLYGNVLKMNNMALSLLGFEDDKVDYNLMNMVYPSDYEMVSESFSKLKENGFLTDFEIDIKTNLGIRKSLHINASIIYDGSEPVAAQGIVRDISVFKENMLVSNVINDITHSILATNDIFEIAIKIVSKIALYLNTQDCVIYSVNHTENQVEQIAATGDKISSGGHIVNRLKFDIGKGVVGTVARTGISELINDTSFDSRYIKDVYFNYSELTVPIIVENKVIGIIDSEHPSKNHYTESQLKTVENISKIVALKIKNAIDLHKKNKVQQSLLKSERRLRTLVTNMETGILLEDQDRKIVLTNSKFCKMFTIDCNPDDMIGWDCVNSAEETKHLFVDSENFISRIDYLLQNKKTVLGDELKLRNGLVFERDYIPLFNDDIYAGHLWNYRDVTLQKQYKSSIEYQKEKYSSIIANMNLGLLEVDNDDKILMCNQSFSKMSGYSEEELLGKTGADVFLDDKNKTKLLEQTTKRSAGISESYEISVKIKNGDVRIWLVSGAPNYNINGELIGTIGIHLDITEGKILQKEKDNLLKILKEKNSELEEYAQIVSHDLKSPLRSISALASWIKSDTSKYLTENSLNHFRYLELTLEKMEALISGVLEYSSIGIKPRDSLVCDFNEIVNDVIIPYKGNKLFSIIVENTLPKVVGDRAKFYQLFQNLVNNAISHNDKERVEVKIGYICKSDKHMFYIKDNGAGIEEDYHDKIFKIFYYIKENDNSTGIGLSIVKKIVELYGGKIWLDSKLGKGTTFYFTLKK